MIYSIVYVSSSTGLYSNQELEALLRESRFYNLRNDITGVLMYCNGNIIQLLEGDEENVNETYRRILRDFRHRQVTVIFSGNVSQRSFEGWSMGYRTLTSKEMDELRRKVEFIDDPYRKTPPDQMLSLLQNFYINNHKN